MTDAGKHVSSHGLLVHVLPIDPRGLWKGWWMPFCMIVLGEEGDLLEDGNSRTVLYTLRLVYLIPLLYPEGRRY